MVFLPTCRIYGFMTTISDWLDTAVKGGEGMFHLPSIGQHKDVAPDRFPKDSC